MYENLIAKSRSSTLKSNRKKTKISRLLICNYCQFNEKNLYKKCEEEEDSFSSSLDDYYG